VLIYIEFVLCITKWDKSCSRVNMLLIRFAGLNQDVATSLIYRMKRPRKRKVLKTY